MNAIDFFTVSRVLTMDAQNEAALRSAVSRAYYGAFHACRHSLPSEFLLAGKKKVNGKVIKVGSHKAVIDALEKWGKSKCAGKNEAGEAARTMLRLRKVRCIVDYELSHRWTINAEKFINDAEAVAFLVASAQAKRNAEVVPESATAKAIAELEAGKGKKFATVDDLMDELRADD